VDSPQAAEQRKNTRGHVAKIWQTLGRATARKGV